MISGIPEINVDLSRLCLSGDVLDMGMEGNGIIYRTMRSNEPQYVTGEEAITIDPSSAADDIDYVYGSPSKLPFEDGRFDAVTLFFSLSYIKTRDRRRTIGEAARILKCGGKLYIWDFNLKLPCFIFKRRLDITIQKEDIIKMDIKRYFVSGKLDMASVLSKILRYFTINTALDMGEYFQIEAVKRIQNFKEDDIA